MVTPPDSSTNNNHSPTCDDAAETNSPKFTRKELPSPWAQVVRGGADAEPPLHHSPPPPSSSPLDSANSNALVVDTSGADKANNVGPTKKEAWKKPSSNGVAEVGPVMGAVSWPSLSQSTKPSAAKVSTDDGSLSTPQGPVTPHSTQKQATSKVKPNHSMDHGTPGPAHNSYSNPSPNLPPPPPPFPVLQISPTPFANGVPVVSDLSPRDPYMNNWDTRPPVGGFMPPMNEYRSPSRRGHFGHHPRGDGANQNNYGIRCDQDRRNYANTRDAHAHQRRMPPRGFMRPPPPNPAPFMGPPPLRPFANPAGFPEYCYFPTLQLEPFGGMPFFTHGPPSAMFFPVAETPLTNTIVHQINYYFSDENLVKDVYLRSNMDDQGWVPISLIAGFSRVKSLTSDTQLMLDSMRTSTLVEVQGDKLRRRSEWKKWLLSAQLRAGFGSTSPAGSGGSNPVADFENLTLKETTADKVDSEPTTDGDVADAAGETSSESGLQNGDDI